MSNFSMINLGEALSLIIIKREWLLEVEMF